jgi:hypothetical protein
MRDDLLENARQQAEQADRSVRAAALLRIARAESAADVSRARQTLLDGLDAVQRLPGSVCGDLLEEAREVAAAIAPDLLADIKSAAPVGSSHPKFNRIGPARTVGTMLAHGHLDDAFNFLLHYEDPASFPFSIVMNVLHALKKREPDRTERRLMLLRHAIEVWTQKPPANDPFERGLLGFEHLFAGYWKELPANEALVVARTIVAKALEQPDTATSSRYPDGIGFSSSRQNTLFGILHVLRHLDPTLAQSLIDTYDQLAAAARRYPNGLDTMSEEAMAESERRKAAGETCQGEGYSLSGDSSDFPRQRRGDRRGPQRQLRFIA